MREREREKQSRVYVYIVTTHENSAENEHRERGERYIGSFHVVIYCCYIYRAIVVPSIYYMHIHCIPETYLVCCLAFYCYREKFICCYKSLYVHIHIENICSGLSRARVSIYYIGERVYERRERRAEESYMLFVIYTYHIRSCHVLHIPVPYMRDLLYKNLLMFYEFLREYEIYELYVRSYITAGERFYASTQYEKIQHLLNKQQVLYQSDEKSSSESLYIRVRSREEWRSI